MTRTKLVSSRLIKLYVGIMCRVVGHVGIMCRVVAMLVSCVGLWATTCGQDHLNTVCVYGIVLAGKSPEVVI